MTTRHSMSQTSAESDNVASGHSSRAAHETGTARSVGMVNAAEVARAGWGLQLQYV